MGFTPNTGKYNLIFLVVIWYYDPMFNVSNQFELSRYTYQWNVIFRPQNVATM